MGEQEIRKQSLDFDSYWMSDCLLPPLAVSVKTTDFLKLLDKSDAMHKKCAERHKGLTEQIKERKILLNK